MLSPLLVISDFYHWQIHLSFWEYNQEVEDVHMQISNQTCLIEIEGKYYRGTVNRYT